MHKDYPYSSVFANLMNDYITARREAGFKYDNPAYWLYRFDQFCTNENIRDAVITKTLYDSWASKSDTESKTTQCNRIQALKNFSIYLNTLGKSSYVPKVLPRPEKVVPYLMKSEDIHAFFKEVDLYETSTPAAAFKRMAQEYKVLFRLIYCCGLRNNEACSLKTENADLKNGIITLYQTKGRKDRTVFLSEDLRLLCSNYLDWLNIQLGFLPEWFFPGKNPMKHIPKTSVDKKFNEFWSKTPSSKTCDKKPTVHCLRYAFVIKRINTWMEADVPLQAMMPYLSRYLGHMGPMETYYYFHQIEDAFQTIRRKDNVSTRVIPEVHYES